MKKLSIKKINIIEDKANEITSAKVFRPRSIVDRHGNFLFHEDGIFSDRIFGKFQSCGCGHLRHEGICEQCKCRVLTYDNIPDFYISFDGMLDIPYFDLHITGKNRRIVNCLMNYEGFLADGEYVRFDVDAELSEYKDAEILIGKDAVMYLGYTESWYNERVYNKLSVPHPHYRRILVQGGKYFLGQMNTNLVDILKKKNILRYYLDLNIKDVFYELNIKRVLIKKIKEVQDEIFLMLAKNKTASVNTELRGQQLTGMIRAVITNNFSLDEDIALIGSYFIPTLYPILHKQFITEGKIDVKAFNTYLKEKDYFVLMNRQPTIGTKSILGMKPVFSESENEKYVLQLNPIIFDGLAGDTDGDVLSIIALYSREAIEEAKLLLPSVNYIEGSNSSIRNKLPEDFVYTLSKLYEEKTKASEEINDILGKDYAFDEAIKKLESIPRKDYIHIYNIIGRHMFLSCSIPTVGMFATAYGPKTGLTKKAIEKIKHIASFTDNYDGIVESINRQKADYSEAESSKFMNSVIAANVTDITESGFFYKKLISSCDDMIIGNKNDCGSEGEQITLPVSEELFNYKVRNRFVVELGMYAEDYDTFNFLTSALKTIHIRTFLTCTATKTRRSFCKKCAGLYKREHNSTFMPKHIGIYSTLMITENATQSSLDSMNKGATEKLTVLLERSFDNAYNIPYSEVKRLIEEVINDIGYIGIESRFYEIALLSRFYANSSYEFTASPLVTSMLRQKDKFGQFIYRPTNETLIKLLRSKNVPLSSVKSKLALDLY